MPKDKNAVSVTIPSSGKLGVPRVTVQGRSVLTQPSAAVDLVFVVDTTGSMSDKIEGLLATISNFLGSFAALSLDHRVAIIAFGDLTVPDDRIVKSPFMRELEVVRRTLLKIPRFSGGGNSGESSLEALDVARNMPLRPDAVKVLVLITDEPALQHQHDPLALARELRSGELITYVISPPFEYFREIAKVTGGTWRPITGEAEFSGLLDLLRRLATQMSHLVMDVHRLAGGSVREYLRLHPPQS